MQGHHDAGAADAYGRADQVRWWLTQPSARRSRWLLDQRNRQAHAAAGAREVTRRFDTLYTRLDVGNVRNPQTTAAAVFWMQRTGSDEVARIVVDAGGGPRTVFDPAALDPKRLTLIDDYVASPDGKTIAVWTSTRGQEDETLVILDVASGTPIAGPITGTAPEAFAWDPRSDGYYAGVSGPRGGMVLHTSLTDRTTHVVTQLPTRHAISHLTLSPDGTTVVVAEWLGDWEQENLWISSTRPHSPPRVIHNDEAGRSQPLFVGRALWLLTTVGDDRGRIVEVDQRSSDTGRWRDIVAAGHSRLNSAVVVGNTIVVASSYEGTDRLTLHDAGDGSILGRVRLPGRGSVDSLDVRGDTVVFAYSDAQTPSRVMEFNVRTGALATLQAPPEPQMPPVTVISTVYPADDGTLVPIEIMFGPAQDSAAPRPTILHAYGGFMSDDSPAYAPDAAAWIAAGGVYVHAHVRGGDVRSEWHENGAGGKAAAVEDLAAAARFLIAEGYTTSPQLALMGASNGGWLVAQTAITHPSLVGAVVGQCGVYDLVNVARWGAGGGWVTEYGDARDPEQHEAVRANSPVHSVVDGVAYPPMLLTAGDDPRVNTPANTFRLLEVLQAANPKGTYLLRYDGEVGHGYGSRSRSRAELRDALAFIAQHTGLVLDERTARGPVAQLRSLPPPTPRRGNPGATGLAA